MTHQSACCQQWGSVGGRKPPPQDGESTEADLWARPPTIAEVTGSRSAALISGRDQRRRVVPRRATNHSQPGGQTEVGSW